MVSTGLKKLGQELGLEIGRGRVYGLVEGFPIAMWDETGTKNISIYLGRMEEGAKVDLAALLPRKLKEYRILEFEFPENSPLGVIAFQNNPGALKRIRLFLEEALPAFREAGLAKKYVCGQCGEAFAGEPEIVLIHGMAVAMHRHCLADYEREAAQEELARKLEPGRAGSLLKGFLGAILGGVIGAIPWVILYVLGYISSLGGLLIGAGAAFGYRKLGGRPGKVLILIVALVAIVMVPLATLAGDVAESAKMILSGEMAEINGLPEGALTLADLGWLTRIFTAVPEWRSQFRLNLVMGYFFAALGLAGFLISLAKSERRKNIKIPHVGA